MRVRPGREHMRVARAVAAMSLHIIRLGAYASLTTGAPRRRDRGARRMIHEHERIQHGHAGGLI